MEREQRKRVRGKEIRECERVFGTKVFLRICDQREGSEERR